MKPWLQVRKELKVSPIVEAMIGGPAPLFVERYVYRTESKTVSGISGTALVSHLGGPRVQEKDSGHLRVNALASESVLVPAKCPTTWHYKGPVDFVAFYFPDRTEGIQERLRTLAEAKAKPLQFADALTGAAAQEIVTELHKGSRADEAFLERLAMLMLEQTYRVLTTPATRGFDPRHTHFNRLQAVLGYIHQHLQEELSSETLAGQAEVSLVHFRRLFQQAMGTPPHRYVLSARLEQARKLLSTTKLPISRIAEDCGFSSQSHLTERFREAHAATPAEFRAHFARSGKSRGIEQ